MFSNLIIDYFFLIGVIIIWFMLGYQFVLFFLGFLYSREAAREKRRLAQSGVELPSISILVPAHNEALVIERTVKAIVASDYPKEKLEVIVIDDASGDATASIVRAVAREHSQVRLLVRPKGVGGKGKSAALNHGLREAKHEVIGIYDADNTPDPEALRHLARQLVSDPQLGAVIGKFRAVNRYRNILTRFINIESLGFQWMVQAGRWKLMRVATLPGTNFLIRRSLLEQLGGWDEEALTEDAELSIRIYEAGYLIKFVPYAVTWEQEPETFSVWLRQRTRWVRGNNYVMAKFLRRLLKFRPRKIGVELLYAVSIYYVFFLAIIISDLLFLLCVARLVFIPLIGPWQEVWLIAFVLFTMEIVLTLTREKGEDSLANILLTMASYFTYCQLWILVVLRGFYLDYIARRERIWEKTKRFEVSA